MRQGSIAESRRRTFLSTGKSKPVSLARVMFVVPVLTVLALGVFLAIGLTRDPRLVPSPLIGKPIPQFRLPPVQGRALGLATENLRGEVSLVNVFASWCVACRQEHPLLMALSAEGVVPVHGLNYKDQPADAAAWLDSLGDPYTRTGADIDGQVGIDWGVYGVPETFVIDRAGRIAFKQIGPISREALEKTILPLVRTLQRGPADGPRGSARVVGREAAAVRSADAPPAGREDADR